MQSITVQYLAPTKHRTSRFKAKCFGGSVTIKSPYIESYMASNNSMFVTKIEEQVGDYLVERTVALALIAKMEWRVEITGAGRDYRGDVVFTLAPL